MDERNSDMANDARQSRADDPALGQRAEDFGAGGQRVINPEPEKPDRDVDRDAKLEKAGVERADAGKDEGETR